MAFRPQEKVIVLVDMDCFYVQVEQRRNPELKGKPCAVVQYKPRNGGGIIAVGYEARKFGVTRMLRGDEARVKCPDIQLVAVPERRGKADLTHYREAGAEVIKILSRFSESIERASVDEVFLDITKNVHDKINEMEFSKVVPSMLPGTHIAGRQHSETTIFKDGSEVTPDEASKESKDSVREGLLREWLEEKGNREELNLTVGALITSEMRNAVLQETGFSCSAGIACNKMLAKLAEGMNKPNQQTILPMASVPAVFNNTAVKKVRHLGGKLGEEVQNRFGIDKIGQLTSVKRKKLETAFGDKTGSWLYDLCRGYNAEPMRVKKIPQSVGCGKNFNGREKLTTVEQILHWLKQLAEEIVERLASDQRTNNRTAGLLTVHFHPEKSETALSRSCPLNSLDAAVIVKNAWSAMNKGRVMPTTTTMTANSTTPLGWSSGILNLSLVASKFRNHSTSGSMNTISSYFTKQESQLPSSDAADISNTTCLAQSDDIHVCTQVDKHSDGNSYRTAAVKSISSYFSKVSEPVSQVPRKMMDTVGCNSGSSGACSQSVSPLRVTSHYEKGRILSYFTKSLERSLLDSPTSDGHSESEETKAIVHHHAAFSEQSTSKPVNTSPSIVDYKSTTFTESEAGPMTKKRRLNFDDSCVHFEEGDTMLFQSCPECGENVAAWNILEHQDFHLALQLHNEEKQAINTPANHCKKTTGSCTKNSIFNYIK